MILVLLVLVLIAFDVAAMRWGVDSRDSFNSAEWERRRHWRGFGGNR